jgi:CubicO group peptidase (beta-lactamase class C family)
VASGPIGTWAYSGGGYTFLQTLLVDISGQPFPDLLKASVLNPLGMIRSTFEQPLPEALQANAARAHVAGSVIKGGWHIYPELAAAGLWTTPTDLARLFIDIRSAYLGKAGTLLQPSTAAQMLSSPVKIGGPFGLGLQLELDNGVPVVFGHTGANQGYLSGAIMFTESGDGVVIMTNSDNWIVSTVYNACANAYGWPLGKL